MRSTWITLPALSLVLAAQVASCGKSGHALSVDLRTDVTPKTEFGSVLTQVTGSSPVGHAVTESSSQYVAGTRVADFDGVDSQSVDVTVTLMDPEGSPLVSRVSRITLTADYALTVVVTRSCAGVVCPIPAGDPTLTTCAAGQCAKPECTIDDPSACPMAECTEDGDCRSEVMCLSPRCDHGTCLFPSDDALCPVGQTCSPDDGCVLADGQPACTPTGSKETNCKDKLDDDCDGRVDCLDDDCGAQPCEDGDLCTQGETCQQSSCVGGTSASCDDHDDCTDDTCDPKAGCAHAPQDGPCDDGDACTTGDTCAAGSCVPGMKSSCDDKNPCTTDTCDAVQGCLHEANSGPCDDGDPCTSGDVCNGGACLGPTKTSCDDKNPCTDDACTKATGCTHTANTSPCDDGVYCNGADTCANEACSVHPGSPCKETCSESMKTCVGCAVDADCGPVASGAWSDCGGFADACSETGTQTRAVLTPHCNAGTCSTSMSTETQACTRNSDGLSCGAVTDGAWSACGGFASTCATAGTQSRTVTTPTCSGGACTNVVSTGTEACARTTDGVTCATTTTTAWSACGGYSSACDTTGTQTRTETTHTCSAGACGSTATKQSQSCTRSVANGTSCGSGTYCCGGSCVSKSSASHCGSCGAVCQDGHTCGQPVAGQWGCHCVSNSECVTAGYGSGATCYTSGGSWCNCQCPTGAETCGGLCAGGATCHDVSGQNYCEY